MAIGRTEQPQLAATPDGGTSHEDIREILASLIRTNRAAARGFRTSADGLEDSDRSETLRRIADERAGFADELVDLGYRFLGDTDPGEPAAPGEHSASADLGEAPKAWDVAILRTVETAEDRVVDTYTEALGADLPSDLDAVVRRHYTSVMQTRDRVRSMREATSS